MTGEGDMPDVSGQRDRRATARKLLDTIAEGCDDFTGACSDCTGMRVSAIAAALTAARQEEREACAKVAEQHDICKGCGDNYICGVCQSARDIAADIRGRARP